MSLLPARKTDPLIVDTYAGDGDPDQKTLSLDLSFAGIQLKFTEGLYYDATVHTGGWAAREWREAGKIKYGANPQIAPWWRGAYHYLKFNQDGAAQADFFLAALARAGGTTLGDFYPMVDVEFGGERSSNRNATHDQVIACTTKFAERIKQCLGGDVILYANQVMPKLGITDRMGCDWLDVARYVENLPPIIYERAGWTLDRVVLWQYAGDGEGKLDGYPVTAPGCKQCDLAVALNPTGGPASLDDLRRIVRHA